MGSRSVGVGGSAILPDTDSQILRYTLFPFMAAWIIGESAWEVYFAFLVLVIPFCVVSILIEEWFLRRAFPTQSKSIIRASVVRANVLSYALLALTTVLYPLLLHSPSP